MGSIVEAAKALCGVGICDDSGCRIIYIQCPGPEPVPAIGVYALAALAVLLAVFAARKVGRRRL